MYNSNDYIDILALPIAEHISQSWSYEREPIKYCLKDTSLEEI